MGARPKKGWINEQEATPVPRGLSHRVMKDRLEMVHDGALQEGLPFLEWSSSMSTLSLNPYPCEAHFTNEEKKP